MHVSSKYLVVPVVVLAGAAAVRAASPAYQLKIRELERAAQEKREGNRAQVDAQCAKQGGTPEMRFEHVLDVKPGQTFTVDAQGHFFTDSTVVPHSDQVKVLSAKVEPTHVSAKLAVDANALPLRVYLGVAGSVCGYETGASVAQIVAATELEAKLANGTQLALSCQPNEGERSACSATWSGNGKQKKTQAQATFVQGAIDVEFTLTEQEQAAVEKRMQEGQTAMEETMKAVQAETDKCKKLAEAEQMPCLMKFMQSDRYQQLSHQNDSPPPQVLEVGCEKLHVDTARSPFHAEGTGCVGGKGLEGQATVQVKP
jgi:hypothetical protein